MYLKDNRTPWTWFWMLPIGERTDSAARLMTVSSQRSCKRHEQRVRAAISRTCQTGLARYLAMCTWSSSRRSSGGPALRMMSSAGKTDSAAAELASAAAIIWWPDLRRFRRTFGSEG